VYRWLVLSLIAIVLAMGGGLLLAMTTIPDWGVAAAAALEHFFPLVALRSLTLSDYDPWLDNTGWIFKSVAARSELW
jgi:hypothetical protein